MNTQYLALAAVGLILYASEGVAQDARRGAEAYKLCASCHGFEAEGNQLVNAPSLAGQEEWYLARQIRNFRDGIRGAGTDDVHGQTMAKMTLALDSDDDDVDDIVAYIATLPDAFPELTVTGDTDSGRGLYQPCGACHGQNAEGNVVLNAPALARMDDWYQLSQLKKFREGQRGAVTGDIYGQQMAPMVATLGNEQAMSDVIAYITSLR